MGPIRGLVVRQSILVNIVYIVQSQHENNLNQRQRQQQHLSLLVAEVLRHLVI